MSHPFSMTVIRLLSSISTTSTSTTNSNSSNSYNYTSYSNSNNSTSSNNNVWWSPFFNQTSFNKDVNELSSNLHPAQDIDVSGVLTSAIFNAMVFIVFMLSYECLRRSFPNVYASKQSKELFLEMAEKKKREEEKEEGGDSGDSGDSGGSDRGGGGRGGGPRQTHNSEPERRPDPLHASHISEGLFILGTMKKHTHEFTEGRKLPDVYKSEIPLGWVKPVFNVSWRKVRELGGLDAYFYLRYIRMCYKITSVSALWGMIILFPTYASGENGAVGWYFFSMSNVSQGSPIIWVSIVFMYLFSAYVLFVIKQEYKHFVELRLDFLSKGDSTDPQTHYSVMVENIPKELRSDSALYSYFDKLYPGRVHSANIILKVPELEALSQRKLRLTRRLEKSIAYYEATGLRPTHITGRFRAMICGIESTPVAMCCDPKNVVGSDEYFSDEEEDYTRKGIRVDSIDYYTQDLLHMNSKMFLLQKERGEIAAFGNRSLNGSGWFTALSRYAEMIFQADLTDDEGDINNNDTPKEDDDNDESSIESLSSLNLYNRRASMKPIRAVSFTTNNENSETITKKLGDTTNGVPKQEIHLSRNPMYGSLEDRNDILPPLSYSNNSGSPSRIQKWLGNRKGKASPNNRDELDIISDGSKEEPLIVKKPVHSKSVNFSQHDHVMVRFIRIDWHQ